VDAPFAEPSSRRSIVAWALVLIVVLLARTASGVDSALHFSGPPVDGPFQLFNALRRIAAGERGGADFQFFHGMGVPYLHYLPFRLFGGGFLASEITRQLISIIAYPLVIVIFFRAFTRDWPRILALSSVVYFVSIALPLRTITTPTISMLGIRSSLPTLVPVVMYATTSRRSRALWIGVMLGAALLLGTEQGLAVLVAFVVVSAIGAWRAGDRLARVRETLVAIAIAVATLLMVLLVIGGPRGVAGALRYNFKLVPGDQFWYFGAPASVFAPDWASVFALMRQMPRIPLTLLAALGVIGVQVRRLWREPDGEAGRRHRALAVLAMYGLISCAAILGIFYDTYIEPCMRALILIGALELDRLLAARDARQARTPRLGVGPSLLGVTVLSFLIMLVAAPSTIGGAVFTLPHVLIDHAVRRRPATLEGIWTRSLADGQRVVDQHRGPNGAVPTVWSTYSGWLEARNGIFNPTPFDYSMHALGPDNRADYVERFKQVRPALVQTVLPTYLMAEIWLEQTSWEFYEELLRNYRTVAPTQWSIFWERLATPNPPQSPIWSTTLRDGASSVELPVADQFHGDTTIVLLTVQIDYVIHNVLRRMPFVGAMPRYFVSADRSVSRFPVTIDPYTTSARFPVVAARGQNPVLRFATYSLLPGASFEVHRVQVATVPINETNVGWLTNLIETERQRQPLGEGSDSTGRYRWR
jgi:hypothetical protein